MHPQSIMPHTYRRTVCKDGYVLIKVDDCWIYEHRWVMAQVLGRPLTRTERVHHKDGDHGNNAPANLEVLTESDHRRRHLDARRPWGSVRYPDRYGAHIQR